MVLGYDTLHGKIIRLLFFHNGNVFVFVLVILSINTCTILPDLLILLDFSLTVKAATLIFISGCGWAISSATEGKSGFIYNLVKS